MVQHGGKELSFLNLFDAEAAWRLVQRFDEPACVIVKHANPCGVAVDADITTAYERAHACDPGQRLRRASSPSTVRCRSPRPRRWRRCSPRSSWRPGYDDDALATLTAKTQPAGADGPAARRARARRAARRRRVARAAARPGLHRPQRVVGRLGHPADRAAVGRPAVRLDGVRGGQLERHRVRQGPPGVRRSAPGSRTASTRPASPPTGPVTGPSAGVCASDAYFPFRDGLDVGGRRRDHGDHPARWEHPGRRGHRGRRRARHGHGLHRSAPLPALTTAAPGRSG